MKIWLKYLIAAVLGVIFGYVLPLNGGDTEVFFQTLYSQVIYIGRYLVYPLVFFNLVMAGYELWLEKKFLRMYGRMLGYSVLSVSVLSVIGAVFVAIFSPSRVPIIIEEAEVIPLAGFSDQLQLIFPRNLFSIFADGGDFLLPVFVFALVLSIGFIQSRSAAAPAIELFESFSRLFTGLNRTMLEILTIGLFFTMGFRTIQLRSTGDFELFVQLVLVVMAAGVFVIFLLLPLVQYFLGNRKRNPYVWLFAAFPAALSSLLSGDLYFSLGAARQSAVRNMGLSERAADSTIPLGVLFGRAGTALVTSISFVLILRSYSSLDVTFLQYLWIIFSSILISFRLSSVPANALIVSLSVISTSYGQGLEEGFLILLPIAPILSALAVLIDLMVVLSNAQLAAYHEQESEERTVADFI